MALPIWPRRILRSLRHGGDIFHVQHGSVLGEDRGLFDISHVAEEALDANVYLLQTCFDEAAPGVGVVIGELLLDLADAQAVRDQRVRIHADLIFAGDAAEAGDIHHVGNGLELLFERPVLDGFQFHQVVLGIGALQRVPVNLADRTPVRAHLRLQAIGKRDLRKPFQDFLPVPIVVGIVVEDKHHAGEAEKRDGAQMREVRQSIHLNFDGNGDLLFDLFGGAAGPLGDDLDVVVRDVRIGFHRQVVERDRTPDQQQHRQREHHEAVIQREIDEALHHTIGLLAL